MGWISPGFVHAQTAVTLVMQGIVEKRLRMVSAGSSARINRARTKVVEDFMRQWDDRERTKVEWLFLVDTDMVFEPDALSTLLETAEDQERRLVGGLGYIWQAEEKRILPSIVMDAPDDMPESERKFGVIYHDPPADEPRFIEAKATGAFCLLIHGSLLEEMRAHYQGEKDLTYWCFDEIDQGGGKVIGPDFQFFQRVHELTGENPLIDTHVRVGHLKQWELTHEEARRSHLIRGAG